MGCVKNFFAMVGFAAVLLVAGATAYHFRDGIASYVRGIGREGEAVEPATSGIPSDRAFRSARRKSAEMEVGGVARITLVADEVASLLHRGISDRARALMDSLSVTLALDRLTLTGTVRTDIFANDIVARFTDILARRESFEASGDLSIPQVGVAAWTPTAFRIKGVPFPEALAGVLANSITGRDDGTFRFAVPTTVGDVRVRPEGVTFYRREGE